MIIPKRDDERLLVSINRIRFNEDFQMFMEMFKKDLQYFRERNDSTKGDDLAEQQGACQYVKNIIEIVDKSSEILDKVRKKKDIESKPFQLTEVSWE